MLCIINSAVRKRPGKQTRTPNDPPQTKKPKCDVNSSTDASDCDTTTSTSAITTTTTTSDTSRENPADTSHDNTSDHPGDISREPHSHVGDTSSNQPGDISRENCGDPRHGTEHGNAPDRGPSDSRVGDPSLSIDRSSDAEEVSYAEEVSCLSDCQIPRSVYRRSDCAEMNVWSHKLSANDSELDSSQCDDALAGAVGRHFFMLCHQES